ncbi:MAG: dihydroorotase [Firmicutes bacterium]|nr:dihydroorotase [Bacillota bacterium]
MKILIKGGHVVDPSNNVDKTADILIRDGKIAAVAENIDEVCESVINADGMYVVPGAVDMNAALCEPGLEYREDIASGTKAAAAGGITSVAAMPGTSPVCDSAAVVRFIISVAKERGYANVYPIAALSKGLCGKELTEVGDLKENGAVALSEGIKSVESPSFLRKALQYSSMFDMPVIVHCEDKDFSDGGYMNEGTVSARLGLRGINAAAEEIHAARNILIAKALGCKIHLTHISTAGTVEIVRRAKADGIKVTCDTAPQYFALTEDAVDGFDTNAKLNPPLRAKSDVEAIKAGLADGTIDAVASSHMPYHADEKRCEFAAAASGMSSLETSIPVTLDYLVGRGGVSMSDFVKLTALNPAKILGIDKGTLGVGADADIAVLDLEKEHTIRADEFRSKGHNTPFDGFKVKGKPEYVIVGGKIVVNKGNLEEM